MLLTGNCLDELKNIPDNSIDSIVTDPPYGLSFMGKKWDYDVPSTDIWIECLRVLKPGGHLLSFFGTRTYHRGVVRIEDAGFEIRDQIMWIYGSGFPKSTDVSKRIDKEAGAERTSFTVDKDFLRRNPGKKIDGKDRKKEYSGTEFKEGPDAAKRFAPSTDSAKQWQGWGSALKPANEPIVVARKPLEKGLTLAENVLKYGTGAINIDGSRIGTETRVNQPASTLGNLKTMDGGKANPNQEAKSCEGRWPANIIFDETAAEMLDEQSGILSPGHHANKTIGFGNREYKGAGRKTDSGGASRFFYVAKASKSERNAGLEGMEAIESQSTGWSGDSMPLRQNGTERKMPVNQNHHPTVKPIKLMSYLINLVTPPNGTILDPFMGSGSTGCAAKKLGFKFIGIEMNEEYINIAKKRIENVTRPNNT